MDPTDPMETPRTGSTLQPNWRARLGTYFIGVSIGCLLVGGLLYSRAQRVEMEAQQAQAEAEAAKASATAGAIPKPNPAPEAAATKPPATPVSAGQK